jgi:hypothetical protein
MAHPAQHENKGTQYGSNGSIHHDIECAHKNNKNKLYSNENPKKTKTVTAGVSCRHTW